MKEALAERLSFVPKNLIVHWTPATVLMICVVLAFFDKISIAVLFSDPAFQETMGVVEDKSRLGWLMTSFLLSYGFSSVFLSFLGDLFSPKKLIFWSVLSWGILMLIMGFTTTYEGMLINRILLGIAEGPLFALCYSIVKLCYSDKEQARASTMFILGTPIGAALGFPITAYVLGNYDWHTTFYVMGALTLIATILVHYGLRNVEVSGRKRVVKSSHSVNLKRLMSNGPFWLVCFFNIALMTYLWGLNSWIPTYLMEEKGFNLKEFGALSMIPFIGMLIGEIGGALYSDRFSIRRAPQVFIGLLGAGIAMYLMVIVESNILVITMMTISSLMWGVSVSAVFALLSNVSDRDVATTAGGIFNGLANFTSAVVPVLIAYIVAFSGNFNTGIIFLAGVAVAGSIILVPLLRRY